MGTDNVNTEKLKDIETNFSNTIKNYKLENSLFKAVKLFMNKLDTSLDFDTLSKLFKQYDKNKNGELERDEFKECIKNMIKIDSSDDLDEI